MNGYPRKTKLITSTVIQPYPAKVSVNNGQWAFILLNILNVLLKLGQFGADEAIYNPPKLKQTLDETNHQCDYYYNLTASIVPTTTATATATKIWNASRNERKS
jgi:hypothetical protein